MPPTCFGHACDHPQGGLLQTVGFTSIPNQFNALSWIN